MADIAIVLGGAESVWDEEIGTLHMLGGSGLTSEVFCCNSMIGAYRSPFGIDHAVTLHPEMVSKWLLDRLNAGTTAPIKRLWSTKPFPGSTDHCFDRWEGSVGLFAVKIARILGYTKIVLCGVPMTVEAGHFQRKQPWKAATQFRRGWNRYKSSLAPYVRSHSGWTQELFGPPTLEWLQTPIEDRHVVRNEFGLRA